MVEHPVFHGRALGSSPSGITKVEFKFRMVEHPVFTGGPWVRVPAGSLKLRIYPEFFVMAKVYIIFSKKLNICFNET